MRAGYYNTNAPVTRRQFLRRSGRLGSAAAGTALLSASAGAVGRSAEAGSETASVYFEGSVPSTRIAELDQERLLATIESEKLKGVISSDAGKSWGPPFAYLQNGKQLDGFPQSILRLSNGELGMIYIKNRIIKTASYNTPTRMWFFATSSDEGKTWSAGVPLDLPVRARWRNEEVPDLENKGVNHTAFGRLVQLSSGRLVLPLYWYIGGRHPELHAGGTDLSDGPAHATIRGRRKDRVDGHLYEAAMEGSFTYFSDDMGKSWTRSTSNLMVWPLHGEGNVGGFGACSEPVLMELKDRRVLMFMRTNVGRIFQSISQDGGEIWSRTRPTELPSGDVPCCLGRLRSTGGLLVIWNQASTQEIQRGYSRGRLSVAISRDEGKTWGSFRTIERSEGLQPIERVEPPSVRHVRANEELGTLPDNYAHYHYPSLAFVQGKVLLIYNTGRVDDAGFGNSWNPKAKVVEESWLYR